MKNYTIGHCPGNGPSEVSAPIPSSKANIAWAYYGSRKKGRQRPSDGAGEEDGLPGKWREPVPPGGLACRPAHLGASGNLRHADRRMRGNTGGGGVVQRGMGTRTTPLNLYRRPHVPLQLSLRQTAQLNLLRRVSKFHSIRNHETFTGTTTKNAQVSAELQQTSRYSLFCVHNQLSASF